MYAIQSILQVDFGNCGKIVTQEDQLHNKGKWTSQCPLENKTTTPTIPNKKYKTSNQLHWIPHWMPSILYMACVLRYIFEDCIKVAWTKN